MVPVSRCATYIIYLYIDMVLGRNGSASLCRFERENKMAATYNVLGSFHIISTTFWHDPLGFSRNLVLLNPSWSHDSITSFSLIPCMVSFKTLIAFLTIFPTTCCLTIYNFVIFCPISRLNTSI